MLVLVKAAHLPKQDMELKHRLVPARDTNKELVTSYERRPSPATQLFRACTCYPLMPVGVFPAWRAVTPERLRWAEDGFSPSNYLPRLCGFRKTPLLHFTLNSLLHGWSPKHQNSVDSENAAVSLTCCEIALVRWRTALLSRVCLDAFWHALPPA